MYCHKAPLPCLRFMMAQAAVQSGRNGPALPRFSRRRDGLYIRIGVLNLFKTAAAHTAIAGMAERSCWGESPWHSLAAHASGCQLTPPITLICTPRPGPVGPGQPCMMRIAARDRPAHGALPLVRQRSGQPLQANADPHHPCHAKLDSYQPTPIDEFKPNGKSNAYESRFFIAHAHDAAGSYYR